MDNIIDLQSAKAEQGVRAVDILARTVWGEARGEGQAGMTAIAAVIINRVNVARAQPSGDYWWGNSIIRVCQQPLQFSCWNANDPNLPQLQNVTAADPTFAIATRIAQWAASGTLPDPTGGATHYHALNVMPSWALGQTPTAIIGRQVFYKLT
jgi:spore germination cell wall hydrolase CwlJ-like protein